ncbi:beta-1,3-galactosyltransferase brn [Plodia interpunctella]|uniref:beta-1,3-galactosyltransferase brn n=1 Tax=Plodia interpunctella TaxID=58824 RepID=UPI002368B607|nr:beta-1,3-galactosyltransferase brn [Plodia interpunctella]
MMSRIKSRISKTFFKVPRRKDKVLLCTCVSVVCVLYYIFSVGDYVLAKSYDKHFDYPLNIDIRPLVEQIISGGNPRIPKPINFYPYKFLTNSGKCKTIEKLDLFIVVKSAMQNFGHRAAIRQTYGQDNIIPGRIVKTLFFLGISSHPKGEIQKQIDAEIAKHKDIIQIDFHDHYFNNTIKTMTSFRWLYEHCSTADFYLFTDDDMYISVNNLIDYLDDKMQFKRRPLQGDHFYAGYVFESRPLRHKISKWRVSLDEYPWDKWPPYVTAGAYVISNKSMKYLYVGSMFVKHFRFDDVYLGIVAKKLGIEVTHCPQIHFYNKKYSKEGYKDVIAAHGFHDHDELLRVWREQNTII